MMTRVRDWEELEAPDKEIFFGPPFSFQTCRICTDVLTDASVLGCGHTFCHTCIVASLDKNPECPCCEMRHSGIPKPNYSLRDEINSLRVVCKFGSTKEWHGGWEPDSALCQAKITRSTAAEHEVVCPFRAVECPNQDSAGHRRKCEHRCRAKDLASHTTECELRPVACPHTGCGVTLSANRISMHSSKCTHVGRKCPNVGCDIVVHQTALAQHRAVCMREMVTCEYEGCGIQIAREDRDAHANSYLKKHLDLERVARVKMAAQIETMDAEIKHFKKRESLSLANSFSQGSCSLQSQQDITSEVMAFRQELAVARQEMAAVQKSLLAQMRQGSVAQGASVHHVPRDYDSVQAAVDAAAANDRVLIAAGVYKGRVRIGKQVEIVGEAQGTVVLEATGVGSVVVVRDCAGVRLSNVSIRLLGGAVTKPLGSNQTTGQYAALSVSESSIVICDACDLSSTAGCGAESTGKGTELTLNDCTVHNCRQSGILITQNSTATVKGCTSQFNSMDGITVNKGANATLRGNSCRNNDRHGICILERENEDPVSAVVEGNPCRANHKESVHIAIRCKSRVQAANNY